MNWVKVHLFRVVMEGPADGWAVRLGKWLRGRGVPVGWCVLPGTRSHVRYSRPSRLPPADFYGSIPYTRPTETL